MMNSLPPGCYLPVPVVDDPSYSLVLIHPELEESLSVSYHEVDLLKNLPVSQKISQFLTKDPLKASERSCVRPLQAAEIDSTIVQDEKTYEKWLEDKAILRTERFFYNHPSWNVASTRHALMGDFQFKGIGISGPLGRIDYPHINGQLDLYSAIYETVMSWHLSSTPMSSQRVAAMWCKGPSSDYQTLLAREAKSLRLAQFIGLKLSPSEKAQILGSADAAELHVSVLKKLAWLYSHSYDIAAPTLDNLLLDGSAIDCTGIFLYGPRKISLTFLFHDNGDETYKLITGPVDNLRQALFAYQEAFNLLGSELSKTDQENVFWKEMEFYLGGRVVIFRRLFDSMTDKKWDSTSLPMSDWVKRITALSDGHEVLESFFKRSRFFNISPQPIVQVLFSTDEQTFWPYRLSDKIFLAFNAGQNLEPKELAYSILRQL